MSNCSDPIFADTEARLGFIVTNATFVSSGFYMLIFNILILIGPSLKKCCGIKSDCFGCLTGERNHDTISSSIFDTSKVAKRAYIVILGFCAFSLATIYILEYLSRYPVEGSDFIGVYIAQIVGCISIMLIGATPGGGAYRRSPSHNFFVDGIHALAAMAGLMILSGCNYYNASKAPGTPFNIFVIVGSSVALLLFVVFALIAAVNLKIFGSSGSKGDHYSAMDRPDDAEDGGILYQLSYLTQMLCYNITIVVSILASWHRNLDMCWSQLN